MDKIKITSVDFSGLQSVSKLIQIRLDNSINIVEEMNGPEYFVVQIDTATNVAVPIKQGKGLSKLEQYTDAQYAGLYGTFIELEEILGHFVISSLDEGQDWKLFFHNTSLEDEMGDISEQDFEMIRELLNPKAVFAIVDEVLSDCRYNRIPEFLTLPLGVLHTFF